MVVLNKWTTCDVLELPIQTQKEPLRRTYLSQHRRKPSLVLCIWHLQVKQGEKRRKEGAQGVDRGGRGQEERRRWDWGEEEIRRLKVLRLESKEVRLSQELKGKRREENQKKKWKRESKGEEECEQESIMASSKLTLFTSASWTQYHVPWHTHTHSHNVTFPEDSVDQFSVLILMETWAAAEKDSL